VQLSTAWFLVAPSWPQVRREMIWLLLSCFAFHGPRYAAKGRWSFSVVDLSLHARARGLPVCSLSRWCVVALGVVALSRGCAVALVLRCAVRWCSVAPCAVRCCAVTLLCCCAVALVRCAQLRCRACVESAIHTCSSRHVLAQDWQTITFSGLTNASMQSFGTFQNALVEMFGLFVVL
jgi:hypothetical protein